MGDSTQWVKYIELYVNSASTPPQQVASVDGIANLLKKDLLTLEALVREMEMYLTTTDSIIRSRGILLLAEVLEQLAAKPLSSSSIHSLIGFFTERLSDWKALHGALVGCLALLRRKTDVGRVTNAEAHAVAQSYLENLQVQSLGIHDRKLSFQIMGCLLDDYGGAIKDLENLIYGICAAIDEEKDPQCLLFVFHIMESLTRLYPDPSGPLASYAEDLFGILECYFPIHFTHPTGEEDDQKKAELSKALMLAFAATPLFEPFSIPLLLDKLSSSLPSTKVESFKYLIYCSTKYGLDRMAKHTQALWFSVKDATFTTPDSTLSLGSQSMVGMTFQESDIMAHAFLLLQEVIRQDAGFIDLIISDHDINVFVKSLNQYKNFDDIPLQVKQRLHAVGRILSVCAKHSAVLCNKVFENFFPRIMEFLGLSVAKSSESSCRDNSYTLIKRNVGAIYLCIELLAACNYLTAAMEDSISVPDFTHQTCFSMLTRFSTSLAKSFVSFMRSNVSDNAESAYIHFGVRGLQILATFPGRSPVSKSIFEEILLELVSIVTSDKNKTFLWTLALKALVEIGFFIDKFPDSEKADSYKIIVLGKIVSLISSHGSSMPSSLILEAAFDIGTTRKDFMLRVVQGLDEALFSILFASNDRGNVESDLAVKLLDTYANKVLPWSLEIGGSEEIALSFALGLWDKIENTRSFNFGPPEVATVLDSMMAAMKMATAICTERSQDIIINEAFGVLSSYDLFGSSGFQSGVSTAQQTYTFSNSCGHQWLRSLYASVIIALRPQTNIPNGKIVLHLFLKGLLDGHVPSAQALGSLVNKLPPKIDETGLSGRLSLDEAIDAIFKGCIGPSFHENSSAIDLNEIDFHTKSLQMGIQSNIHTVTGLAWIGKGLLMRGHEKIKDVTMSLLSFLTVDRNAGISPQLKDSIEVSDQEDLQKLMKCVADAFHIIMSDSDACLHRQYHATIRPLYKQRFFSTVMPIFSSLIVRYEPTSVRSMLYRAIAHVIYDTPLAAILGEANKLVPMILDCLSMLTKDVQNKEIIYNILLVTAGILVDKNGREATVENAPRIVNQLTELLAYPHFTAIRETAIQCLVAMSELPHTRIYPLRTQVLRAILKALDDPKRIVRQEAVRCRQAWASIASRSLQF